MDGQVSKLPADLARPGEVWCEPLKIYFPQVYRLVKKTASLSTTASNLRPPETGSASEYRLFKQENRRSGVVRSIPLRHLSSSDDHSLVVRHHWSKLLAATYLRGVEDVDPDQTCGTICEMEQAVFTIVKCRTRKSWPGPMIFYLADLFEDDFDIGVQIWEMSIGIDGELRPTEIFYNED